MIINVRKYMILGTNEDLDLFFERAQQHGYIEFLSSGKRGIEAPVEIQNLLTAIKILRKLAVRKNYEGLWEVPYANEVAKRIIELKVEIERLMEEKRLIEAEIYRVSPFGDFSMEEIDFIERQGKRKIQFFVMKSGKSHKMSFGPEVIYVGTDYDLDYFITINPEAASYPDMIEMRIDRSESELKEHLSFVKESLHTLEVELKSYAGHIEFLQDALFEQLNDYNLLCAKKDVAMPLDDSIFAVEAWIPDTKAPLIFPLLEGLSVHCEQIKIEPEDKVPTQMENTGMNRLGEDLVRIYDIPATTDKDPSGWVFWFFALFFAIIVADGGYGLLYLGLAGYMKYKFPTFKGSAKRLFRLFVILSCFVVGWGVLTSAFFGMKIDRTSFLGKLSPLQYMVEKKAQYHLDKQDDVYKLWEMEYPALKFAKTGDEFLSIAVEKTPTTTKYLAADTFGDNILLEFSLMLGIFHIAFSFLRYLWRNWAGIGWIGMMIGGYLYAPHKLNATSIMQFMGWIDPATAIAIGIQLVYVGIGSAVFLALVQRRMGGLAEIMNLVQVFADVLSYLRLYALALAGSIMAATFNDMGEAIGLLGGFFVIIAGHGVNILLGIMAGVIHGLRLNFIEWYHYSFEGGGRLFNPLRLLKARED